ncbi:peptidoglycan endopeptidase [Herbaspirillum lusitanum]|uniref:C40 family peptidase n=1 Tax=Herbaspirillum lusitanum TaxID=213312 RepID=UPI002237EDB7|nr:C40 family peptidase [Herbaspirillum lusitanum]MCW5300211.1 peptidoglycan endopeptidase [Herbaspirillum lusitanum]
MTTRNAAKTNRFRRHLAKSCVLAAGFWFCSAAWSIETPLQQDTPPPGKANIALAKLHDITNRASELAVQALSMLGINYRYGGTSPETGLDCSGLVRYVFKEALGTDLPRTSAEISRVGEKVVDLRPGDLVFYNTLRRGFSHVGIYLGDGKFIHSPSAGGQVRIEDMDVAYWKKRFNGARRISATAEDQQ